MKENWTYKRFDDIMTPAKVERCGNRTDLPVLSITMHGGIVEQNDRFKKTIASVDRTNYKVVKNGQLVISFPIDEGLLYTQDVAPEGIMSPAYNIWDVDYSQIDRKFLIAYFHSKFAFSYYKAKLRGSTQRRRSMDKADLLSMPIPVPPLEKQKQIIKELDLLSGLKEKHNAQIAELENFSESIFFEMFGDPITNEKKWDLNKLGDIFYNIKNGANIQQTKGATGYPITRIETLSNSVFNRDRLGYADITEISKYQSYVLNTNDILVSHINSKTNIGRAVVYVKEGSEIIIHGMNLLRLVPTDSIVSIYACYFFKSSKYKDDIARIRKDAVNQSSFSISDFKKILIPLPPLSLQQEFAAKIEAIESMKAKVSQSLKETEELFNSRMDFYFN